MLLVELAGTCQDSQAVGLLGQGVHSPESCAHIQSSTLELSKVTDGPIPGQTLKEQLEPLWPLASAITARQELFEQPLSVVFLIKKNQELHELILRKGGSLQPPTLFTAWWNTAVMQQQLSLKKERRNFKMLRRKVPSESIFSTSCCHFTNKI